MIDVFLLLGSNLGDRYSFMNKAVEYIKTDVGTVIKTSSVYETQSWGKTDAPDYLNQVIVVQTALSATVVLEKILNIEILLGRRRDEKWGSRTIDIDILFYGSEMINEPGLHVPHPELHNRRFTLAPLAEIAPEFIHPEIKKNILALQTELKDGLNVKKLYF